MVPELSFALNVVKILPIVWKEVVSQFSDWQISNVTMSFYKDTGRSVEPNISIALIVIRNLAFFVKVDSLSQFMPQFFVS